MTNYVKRLWYHIIMSTTNLKTGSKHLTGALSRGLMSGSSVTPPLVSLFEIEVKFIFNIMFYR